MRDEAHLLLERQLVSDALDSDPFELMRDSSDGNGDEEEKEEKVDGSVLLDKKKNREMIERFKVSCGPMYCKIVSFACVCL
jgi:hypothetical protein